MGKNNKKWNKMNAPKATGVRFLIAKKLLDLLSKETRWKLVGKARMRGLTMRPQATFSFFIFSLSLSPFHPRRSFLLIPPRPSFLFVPLSSSSLLLNRLESVKGHFSSIWTKALPTDGRTDGLTNQPANQQTDKASYRDSRTHLKKTA